MPGLGKSGTCRMRCFSFSITLPLVTSAPHREPGRAPGGDVVQHVDPIDARRRRSAPDFPLEPIHRVAIPFGKDFDGAVAAILHPARQTLDVRRFLGEEPEPHTLHAALHDEPPADEHDSSIAAARRAAGYGRQPGRSARQKMNAAMSANSSSRCVFVDPMPCPASSSIRSSTGFGVPDASRRAANFAGSQGATRGSFRPVVMSTAGYRVPSFTCCTESISSRFLKPISFVTVPNSGMLGGPFGENSARSVFAAGT